MKDGNWSAEGMCPWIFSMPGSAAAAVRAAVFLRKRHLKKTEVSPVAAAAVKITAADDIFRHYGSIALGFAPLLYCVFKKNT